MFLLISVQENFRVVSGSSLSTSGFAMDLLEKQAPPTLNLGPIIDNGFQKPLAKTSGRPKHALLFKVMKADDQ